MATRKQTSRQNPATAVEATPTLAERRVRLGGRSARVRSSVLESAFSVLIEKGIHGFAIAEVAARAGVHETSIYRRWGTRTELAVAACLHFADGALPIPDTGSLRSDLAALLRLVGALLASPQGRALLTLSVSREPDVVAARRAFWRQRFDRARVMLDRAVSRGEFPGNADPIVFLETLIAPLYLRLLVTDEPLDEWPGNEMIDRLLTAYGSDN
jgi:AcrR family transcriptional regulator